MDKDQLGRNILQKTVDGKPIGYSVMTYPSRALDWINLRQIFTACLNRFKLNHLIPLVADIRFAWRYHENLASFFYKPAEVFKKFSVEQLLDQQAECACLRVHRFARFLDARTNEETFSFSKAQIHVRTIDVRIIQHPKLKEALDMGLNHIPLKPTNIATVVATALDAFSQFMTILNLESEGLPFEEAIELVRMLCLDQLKLASRTNRSGL